VAATSSGSPGRVTPRRRVQPGVPGGLRPPVEPMLAAPTDRLPAGAGWVYEPKWDGSPDTCRVSSEGCRPVWWWCYLVALRRTQTHPFPAEPPRAMRRHSPTSFNDKVPSAPYVTPGQSMPRSTNSGGRPALRTSSRVLTAQPGETRTSNESRTALRFSTVRTKSCPCADGAARVEEPCRRFGTPRQRAPSVKGRDAAPGGRPARQSRARTAFGGRGP
jgi:hypothetical protein